MQKLSPVLKVLSIIFLALAFVAIFLTLVNNGQVGITFGDEASALKSFIDFFPSWLGLYPFAVFFFLASLIALTIHPVGKRLILYSISFVILTVFTLVSKYLVVNKGNITFILMIVAALLVMLSFAFVVVFYKDTDKKPKDKRYKATLKEKKELKQKEKEALKQEKSLLKEIEKEEREQEKTALLKEAEQRRLERERLAEEKERLRKQAIEERRIALEERKALRAQELQDREQKRQDMLLERQNEKERLIREREELVKQRNLEREMEKQRRLDEKNKAIAEYNAEIQRKKEEALQKAEERKALLEQRERERIERKEAELRQRQKSPIPSPVQFPPNNKPWNASQKSTLETAKNPINQTYSTPAPSYTSSKQENDDDDDYDDIIIVEDDDDEEASSEYQNETLKRNIEATIKPTQTVASTQSKAPQYNQNAQTPQNSYAQFQATTTQSANPTSINQAYANTPKPTPSSFTTPKINEQKEEEQDNNEEMSGIGGLSEKSSRPRTFHYAPPSIDLLEEHPSKTPPSTPMELEIQMTTLVEALKSYNILCDGDGYIQGPTVTLFKLIPHVGVKVSKIASLADDIARYLGVSGSAVRVIPTIPGTHDIGIEVPNSSRQMVSFKSLVPSLLIKKLSLPFSLGKTITGETVEIDIAKTPHLLIAGATGSGKSVCVNSMIASLLYKKGPGDVRMIMVDPKVVELQMYNGIPHLLTPVITEPKKAIKALDFAIEEMERRYRILEGLHVRNIIGYNEKLKEEKIKREKLPYILIIVDEFADLMMVVGKELEARIARLAAKARAVGIHLVLATQRPSTDVVTGTLKNNLPSRIAFRVPSGIDSRTIIDVFGAEKLLGNGDMLYKAPDASDSVRIQGAFLSDEETERIVEYCKTQGSPTYIDESWFEEKSTSSESDDDDTDYSNSSDEEQLRRAWEVCAESGKCSTTFIQRRLRIGYPTAARIVDELEERGIVSPSQGAKPREVLKFPD